MDLIHISGKDRAVNGRRYSVRELLEAAGKGYPDLWKGDGTLNLNAVSRFMKRHGYPVSQPTLLRLAEGEHEEPSRDTIEALHSVFHIPREMLRGEPMTADLEKLIATYTLPVLFLAERLSRLNKDDFDLICKQIELALDRQEKQRTAIRDGNVTSIDRTRR